MQILRVQSIEADKTTSMIVSATEVVLLETLFFSSEGSEQNPGEVPDWSLQVSFSKTWRDIKYLDKYLANKISLRFNY